MDRNTFNSYTIDNESRSLSARRAWIEITVGGAREEFEAVALRKESVDRNSICPGSWILPPVVALRKESVDRNINREMSLMRPYGRSPQGERG